MKPATDHFGKLLDALIAREHYSRYRVARLAGVDPSYITRVCAGDREAPRPHVIEALARALKLSLSDRNRLMISGGYAPSSIAVLGWDDALEACSDVLTDPRLSEESREQFRQVVVSIARCWKAGG